MMPLERAECFFERLAGAVAALGGLGLILATVVTCVSILLKMTRRILDAVFAAASEPVSWSYVRPILGEEELVTYGVGLALFSALPWVMITRGHIRIELFKPVFGELLNRLLDFAGDVSLACIAYLIMSRQWFLIFKKASKSQDSMASELLGGELSVLSERLRTAHESQILGIPLWPTYVVAEICVILFFIVACFCALRSALAVYRAAA